MLKLTVGAKDNSTRVFDGLNTSAKFRQHDSSYTREKARTAAALPTIETGETASDSGLPQLAPYQDDAPERKKARNKEQKNWRPKRSPKTGR